MTSSRQRFLSSRISSPPQYNHH